MPHHSMLFSHSCITNRTDEFTWRNYVLYFKKTKNTLYFIKRNVPL